MIKIKFRNDIVHSENNIIDKFEAIAKRDFLCGRKIYDPNNRLVDKKLNDLTSNNNHYNCENMNIDVRRYESKIIPNNNKVIVRYCGNEKRYTCKKRLK